MKINSLFPSLVSTTPIEQNAKEKLSRQKRFSSLPNFADLTLADIAECINRNQKYCLRMTSSRDEALCQHAVAGAGPKDWTGGDIAIKHNSKTVAIMPRGFEDFEYCFNGIDVSTDKIQLQSSNTDGVCITSLSINDKKLFLGKHNEQQSFWIDRQLDEQFCLDDFMSTSEITIQNGNVISSTCKPLNQPEVVYIDPAESDDKITIHSGHILDGITVDGHLFGSNGGSPDEIRLSQTEYVVSLNFGYHKAPYWNGGTLCRVTINTNQSSYGPFANDYQCEGNYNYNIPTGWSFKKFLSLKSSQTGLGKIKLI